MAEVMNPATGEMELDDEKDDPTPGGLAEEQEIAAADAAPPPDVSDTGPPSEPEPQEPEPQTPEGPGAAPGTPPAGAPVPASPSAPPDQDANDIAPPPEAPALAAASAPADASAADPDGLMVPPSIVPPSEDQPPGSAGGPTPIVPATTRDEVTQQQIDERQSKAVADTAAAQDKAKAADEVRKLREKFDKDRQEIINKGENAYAAAKVKQDAEYNKYRAMGERDAWGDHATAKKVLAGLAMILGGRKAIAAVIGAAEGFEAKKKEQLDLQKTAMEKAGHDAEEVEQKNKEAIASLSQQTAAGLDATAARLDAELANRGVPAVQRAANSDILALKQAAFDKKRQAEIQEHKWAEDKLKDDLAKNKTQADIELAKARAAELNRRHAKGAGGGGGVKVGPDGITPAERLSAAIEAGMPDGNGGRRPLTPTEEVHAAAHEGIPLKGKAGVLTLKDVKENAAFNANQARKQGTFDRAGEKHDEAAIRDPWSGDVIGPAPNQRSLPAARKSQSSGVQLVDSLKEYRNFLAEHGTKNWAPEDIAKGTNLWASAVAQGRVWSELPSSEAGLDLEKAKYGGQPIITDLRPTSINVIDDEIKHVIKTTRMRANILAGKPADYVPPKSAALPGASDPLAPAGGAARPAGPAASTKQAGADPKLEAAMRVKDDPTAPPAVRARAQKYFLEHR